MYIIGISAFFHDSAAALISDGEIIAAAQEERFTRIKNDPSFPVHAIRYVVKEAGISFKEIEYVSFYEVPLIKATRIVKSVLLTAPLGVSEFSDACRTWISDRIPFKALLLNKLRVVSDEPQWSPNIAYCNHHLSHAASAFLASPFDEAAILVVDGVGEFATTSLYKGEGSRIIALMEMRFPNSLGLLYSTFTDYLGFKVDSGEYKVMGLAPYGLPRFTELIWNHLVEVKADGSFRLNMKYFGFVSGRRMINSKFCGLFGRPPRSPEGLLDQFHMDIAASIQNVLNEILLRITRHLASMSASKNLCIAGGVGLNCVSNRKIAEDGRFTDIWIQPASGDAGAALGAALTSYFGMRITQKTRSIGRDLMKGCYLGPSYTRGEIEDSLLRLGAVFEYLSDEQLFEECAKKLMECGTVGWFQGRMEFGPRALGNRSILADPRSMSIQKTLNLQVKFRESFRPFAPAVLEEEVHEYFALAHPSPYMLFTAEVSDRIKIRLSEADQNVMGLDRLALRRSTIPGVTHVDYSARVQTVNAETNPRFHSLITRFKAKTGCPVLVNTSLNVRGEPIVCSPVEAFKCFMKANLDLMAIENFILRRQDQIVPHGDDRKWVTNAD